MDPNNAGAPMLCANNIVKSFGKVKVLKAVRKRKKHFSPVSELSGEN